jgi:hypothetical protein
VIAGFCVTSINEWRVSQPRVLVLTRNAYYRVKYEPQVQFARSARPPPCPHCLPYYELAPPPFPPRRKSSSPP